MAFAFNRQPPESTWALNHHYFVFNSLESFTPDRCIVTVKNALAETIVTLILYPGLDGKFTLDTLAILKSLFSNRDDDQNEYDIINTPITDTTLRQVITFDFEILFLDSVTTDEDTKTIQFIRGFGNADPNQSLLIQSNSASIEDSRKELANWPLYRFEGYPFEFSYIEQTTNLIRRVGIASPGVISPELYGVKLMKYPSKGIYLKWFNSRGGYNYWLFDCAFQQTIDTDSLGSLRQPNNNVGRQILNEQHDLGREFGYKLNVNSAFELSQKEFINSLLYSDEVYFYNWFKSDTSIQDSTDFFRRISLGKNAVRYNTKTERFEVNLELISYMDFDLARILKELIPPPVENLLGIYEEPDALLSWDAVDSSALAYYNIYRDGVYIARSFTNSYTDSNVGDGSYVYGVSSVNGKGDESAIVEVEVSSQVNFTTFAEYATGVPPDDWSYLWDAQFGSNQYVISEDAVGQIYGSKTLKAPGTAPQTQTLVWDVPGIIAGDVEVLTLIKITTATGSGAAGAMICATPDNPADTGSAYQGPFQHFSRSYRINETVNGSNSNLVIGSGTWALNTWYWVRMKRVGNTISTKTWVYGTAEPGAPQMSTTDASPRADGRAGICNPGGGVMYVDYFAFGDGSEPLEVPTP